MRGEAASSIDFMFMETSDRPVSTPTLTLSLVLFGKGDIKLQMKKMTISSFTLVLNAKLGI